MKQLKKRVDEEKILLKNRHAFHIKIITKKNPIENNSNLINFILKVKKT